LTISVCWTFQKTINSIKPRRVQKFREREKKLKTENFKKKGYCINLRNHVKITALFIITLFVLSVLSFATVQAATLNNSGNTIIGTIFDANDANAQSVSYFKCTTSGSVTDIIAYIDGTSTGNAIAALYAVNGNSAGTLLEQSKPVSISTTFSWVDFQLSIPYTVTSGTTYGLAIMGNVPINVMEVSGTGQRDHNAASTYTKGFSNPFGGIWGTESSGGMSIYAAGTDSLTSSPTPTAIPIATPTPTPTAIPIATPKPTSTPISTPFNANNLAPINDGKWYSDASWSTCPADNIYYDTQITHNGMPTWRFEPGNSYGVDHEGISVKGGDHVVMSCWIKTTGTPTGWGGQFSAHIGMDFYGVLNGQWARIGGMCSTNDLNNLGAGNEPLTQYVNYGSDWTFVYWDFTVPTTWYSDGAVAGPHQFPAGQYATITEAFPWCGSFSNWGSYGTETAWFSDFQLYVNP
jgi:hypothetical protein